MSIVNFFEREVFFPVLALLGERRRAETNLDPLHAAIGKHASRVHIAEVFISRDGALAERPVLNRAREWLGLIFLEPGSNEVAHISFYRGTRVATCERRSGVEPDATIKS